jgi:hypothetical protein
MSAGFYKRRSGILEQIRAGEIDRLESGLQRLSEPPGHAKTDMPRVTAVILNFTTEDFPLFLRLRF